MADRFKLAFRAVRRWFEPRRKNRSQAPKLPEYRVHRGLTPEVALDISDIYVTDEELRIRLPSIAGVRHSGRVVTILRGERADTCPVRAIRAWYAISGIRWGALFRPIDRHGRVGPTRLTDRAVALVIKRAARRAGLDPSRYAGHSLRAGFVTAALAGGAPERVIRAQTGLRSLSTGRRSIGRFDKSAAAYLGL